MKIHLDRVDNKHVIEGWEQHRFSSREDAETAVEFARAFDGVEMHLEWRNRRAAGVIRNDSTNSVRRIR